MKNHLIFTFVVALVVAWTNRSAHSAHSAQTRTTLGQTQGARPALTDPAPSGLRMQHFRLAKGGEFDGAIIGYSLQSRVITVKMANGNTAHVAPRDLTAVSKLKWLSSPAFYDAAKQLNPPRGWLITILVGIWPALLGVAIGAFVCFWLSVGMVSGQKDIKRAAKTYLKMIGLTLLLAGISITAQYAVGMVFEGRSFAPMLRSVLLVGGFLLALLTAYSQIGSDYGLSGGPQFGVLLTGAGIGLGLSTVLLYLVPRFLERPGLDDWFTDQLLAPLGLA